jgi:RNA polymerase sigma-B factor
MEIATRPDARRRRRSRHGRSQGRLAERRLLQRYHRHADFGAREELIHRFLPLVRKLARRYAYTGEPCEDLEQVACVGLLKAVDRFDPSRGNSFASYALPSILGELKRYFRDSSWSVRVPRGLRDRAVEVTDVIDRMSSALGRRPSPREVAQEMGLSLEQVLEASEAASAYSSHSLDGPVGESGITPLESLGAEDPGYERVESVVGVMPALQLLRPEERLVLRLRFEHEMTQSQIGERIGVSQMQVCRILRRALERLREATEEGPT